MIDIAKTAEEYNEVFDSDESLVIFVRKNIEINPIAVKNFIDHLMNLGFNEKQIEYTKELLIFINQNGQFNRSDLLIEELNFNGIFNSSEISLLIKEVEAVI
jgi:hypothetical protein